MSRVNSNPLWKSAAFTSPHNLIYLKLMNKLQQTGGVPPPTGNKFDQDKPPMALLDPEFLEGVSRVLGFGANKYVAHNWRAGISTSRLISAAYRHLGAINKGEDYDPESGLQHSYHLACCIMFLASMINNRPDMDDRYKVDTVYPTVH